MKCLRNLRSSDSRSSDSSQCSLSLYSGFSRLLLLIGLGLDSERTPLTGFSWKTTPPPISGKLGSDIRGKSESSRVDFSGRTRIRWNSSNEDAFCRARASRRRTNAWNVAFSSITMRSCCLRRCIAWVSRSLRCLSWRFLRANFRKRCHWFTILWIWKIKIVALSGFTGDKLAKLSGAWLAICHSQFEAYKSNCVKKRNEESIEFKRNWKPRYGRNVMLIFRVWRVGNRIAYLLRIDILFERRIKIFHKEPNLSRRWQVERTARTRIMTLMWWGEFPF